MRFYNRKEEIKNMKRAMEEEYCFYVLTGRRRMGKTRLVREALKGVDHLEFFIPRKTELMTVSYLREQLERQEGYSPSFSNLDQFFEYVLRTFEKPIFLDEISNLPHISKGSASTLQFLVDKYKEEKPVRLIITGSYVGMMQRMFLDAKEPLFGRASNILELKPLHPSTAVNMLLDMGYSLEDSVEAWTVVGGIPRYIELCSSHNTFPSLVEEMFTPGSVLLHEGENVLIQEFGNASDTFFAILEAIGRRNMRPTDICQHTGMSIQTIPRYLETLRKMDLVERTTPMFGSTRHVRYSIKENYLLVWFSKIYPYIEEYRNRTRDISTGEVNDHVGRQFENFVKSLLPIWECKPFIPSTIGSWWDRQGNEIDIIASDTQRREMLFGECKWTKKQATWGDVVELKEKSKLVQTGKATRKEHYLLISKSGFTPSCTREMEDNGILYMGMKDIQGIIEANKE